MEHQRHCAGEWSWLVSAALLECGISIDCLGAVLVVCCVCCCSDVRYALAQTVAYVRVGQVYGRVRQCGGIKVSVWDMLVEAVVVALWFAHQFVITVMITTTAIS